MQFDPSKYNATPVMSIRATQYKRKNGANKQVLLRRDQNYIFFGDYQYEQFVTYYAVNQDKVFLVLSNHRSQIQLYELKTNKITTTYRCSDFGASQIVHIFPTRFKLLAVAHNKHSGQISIAMWRYNNTDAFVHYDLMIARYIVRTIVINPYIIVVGLKAQPPKTKTGEELEIDLDRLARRKGAKFISALINYYRIEEGEIKET